MLNRAEFEILRNVFEGNRKENDSVVLKSLTDQGYINELGVLTEKALDELKEFQVDNAIILAAGMSTRFVPVSYELPKGLISVKGEVLIERLIRQLRQVGIMEIVVVVGYMMEKFLYLRDKYGVKLVVNNEYSTKNTHSSIYVARDYLKNTYICCSDNYYPQNQFHKYEYSAYYCSIFLPGTSYVERAFTFDDDGLIIDTNKPSKDQWIMYGHAYYNQAFSKSFKPILKSYYGREGVENMYWENVYAENVDKLPMYIKQCKNDEILEFDSMDELKVFDPDFIKHNRVKIFENICSALQCEFADISNVEIVKKGLNNRSFKFTCKGQEYIYRHPGINAQGVIDRKKEAKALHLAKDIGADNTLVYVNEQEGWKISRFIHTTEEFDFAEKKHVEMLAQCLKKLHGANIQVGYSFDYEQESLKLIDYVKSIDRTAYYELSKVQNKIQPIADWLKKDKWQVSLCHNDIYEPNLLVENERIELIDWEFAGDSDIGYDICKLFSLQMPAMEDVDEWLYAYFGRNTTQEEKIHLFACASMIYYYWFVWSIYESKQAGKATSYIIGWHDKMNYYADATIKALNKED